MDAAQTAQWYQSDPTAREKARALFRQEARLDGLGAGADRVELAGADGVVADAFELEYPARPEPR